MIWNMTKILDRISSFVRSDFYCVNIGILIAALTLLIEKLLK